MFGAALRCWHSQLGIVVHSTSATDRHVLHADRRGGSNTAQDPKSIQSRRRAAWRLAGPRTRGESRDKIRGLQLEHLVLPAKTGPLYLALRSLGPYRSSVVLSLMHNNLDYGHTFSGSRSGKTSENPVSKALGKIARREFARCAAIVSTTWIQGGNKDQNEGTHVT
jgi:hypothetical protein